MNLYSLRAPLALLFSPSRFEEMVMAHDSLPTEDARRRATKLRRAVGTAYGVASLTLVAGLGSAALLSRFVGLASSAVITGLQFIAAIVILGATLGVAGREIESWNGHTLPEKTDRWLYVSTYVVGTYLLVVSLAWSSR